MLFTEISPAPCVIFMEVSCSFSGSFTLTIVVFVDMCGL